MRRLKIILQHDFLCKMNYYNEIKERLVNNEK